MIIETSAWGSIEVTEEQIYQFPKGIPGFEQETSFALLSMEGGPFAYLQSLKEKELAFVLADPFVFYPEYEFELPDSESTELALKEGHVYVRNIVTLKDPIEQSSINLLAPIVMNTEKKIGKQVVLHHSSYRTSHRLWNDSATESIDTDGKGGA
ncbi:flagellar assembly protein FliW [Paenibacillus dakarensis]|uniref:flagellar assembly protein FliW n=1 Tax=Paenibacillus dakarensis TaxID=1527293 RepID=UPI0006D58BEB|nr:flagellar assembly protein FliW [Paenibacillus dakarensis]